MLVCCDRSRNDHWLCFYLFYMLFSLFLQFLVILLT